MQSPFFLFVCAMYKDAKQSPHLQDAWTPTYNSTQLKLNNRTGIKMAVQNLSAPADNPLQQQGMHMGMTDLFMY